MGLNCRLPHNLFASRWKTEVPIVLLQCISTHVNVEVGSCGVSCNRSQNGVFQSWFSTMFFANICWQERKQETSARSLRFAQAWPDWPLYRGNTISEIHRSWSLPQYEVVPWLHNVIRAHSFKAASADDAKICGRSHENTGFTDGVVKANVNYNITKQWSPVTKVYLSYRYKLKLASGYMHIKKIYVYRMNRF